MQIIRQIDKQANNQSSKLVEIASSSEANKKKRWRGTKV